MTRVFWKATFHIRTRSNNRVSVSGSLSQIHQALLDFDGHVQRVRPVGNDPAVVCALEGLAANWKKWKISGQFHKSCSYGATTFSIMTLSMRGLFVTLSIMALDIVMLGWLSLCWESWYISLWLLSLYGMSLCWVSWRLMYAPNQKMKLIL